MAIVGRAKFDHPALGTAGGSSLFTSIETLYTNTSDDLNGRFKAYSSIADSTTNTYEHGFGVDIAELTVLIYTGTHPSLTRVTDPVAAGWVIAATGGFTKTKVDITTPGSGGPHTFVAWILHTRAAQYLDDLDDVTLTSPSTGQVLTYNGSIWVNQGTGISNYALKTTTYTAANRDKIIADTSGGAFTITLPLTPTVGDSVIIKDATRTWSTNNLTIARNGEKIQSNAANYIGNVDGDAVELVYISSAEGWGVY